MKGTLTHISPRDIVNYEERVRNGYEDNFKRRLATRLKVDSGDVGSILSAMFGSEWILQPYNKLYRAVKMSTRKASIDDESFRKYNRVYKLGTVSNKYKVGEYRETIFYKKACELYGKKTVEQMTVFCLRPSDARFENDHRKSRCKDMLRINCIVKRYAPELYKEFIKKAKQDRSTIQNVESNYGANFYGYFNRNKLGEILGEELTNEIKHDLIEIALRPSRNNTFLNHTIEQVTKKATTLGYYGSGTYYYKRYFGQLTAAITEYYKAKQMIKMLNELGLENNERVWGKSNDVYYRANKLNSKAYRLILQTYKAKGDDNAKKMTLYTGLHAIRESEYRARMFVPALCVSMSELVKEC